MVQNFNSQLADTHTMSENVLLSLADDMAAAATSFNANGYEVLFVQEKLLRSRVTTP